MSAWSNNVGTSNRPNPQEQRLSILEAQLLRLSQRIDVLMQQNHVMMQQFRLQNHELLQRSRHEVPSSHKGEVSGEDQESGTGNKNKGIGADRRPSIRLQT
jgi:hypothetical protein